MPAAEVVAADRAAEEHAADDRWTVVVRRAVVRGPVIRRAIVRRRVIVRTVVRRAVICWTADDDAWQRNADADRDVRIGGADAPDQDEHGERRDCHHALHHVWIPPLVALKP